MNLLFLFEEEEDNQLQLLEVLKAAQPQQAHHAFLQYKTINFPTLNIGIQRRRAKENWKGKIAARHLERAKIEE